MLQQENLLEYDSDWKSIYLIGGISCLLVFMGIIADIIIGTASAVDLNKLPLTASERFSEFSDNPLAGLYHLDFLNMIVQLLFIPVYLALFAAHRKNFPGLSALALIVFVTGTIIIVTNNAALRMLDLSGKYFAADSVDQKNLYKAAGESLLLGGVHGCPGAFLGFLIPCIAGFIISLAMLKGKIFSRTASYLGISGNILMIFIPLVLLFYLQLNLLQFYLQLREVCC